MMQLNRIIFKLIAVAAIAINLRIFLVAVIVKETVAVRLIEGSMVDLLQIIGNCFSGIIHTGLVNLHIIMKSGN
jgi:hypothetical protein